MSSEGPVADDQAIELATFSRALYARGWMPGTAGNLSVRRSGLDNRALITASGRSKGELDANDVVEVDVDTGLSTQTGGASASAEVSIHSAIYKTTCALAVVHVHSPFATAVASRVAAPNEVVFLRLEHYELLKGLGLQDPTSADLAIVPNWPQVPQIGADLADHLSKASDPAPAFLIAYHGITAWGSDLAQARNRVECLEAICQQLIFAAMEPTSRTPHPEG
jgi:methylthioribulose-1-phosphate dehydratase